MSVSALAVGELRHRVQLAAIGGVQDSFGGIPSDQGSVYATVWAKIEGYISRRGANAPYIAQTVNAEVSHIITIRWRRDVLAKHVVWYEGRQFHIQSVVNPDERHKLLVLLCLERNDSQIEKGGSAA